MDTTETFTVTITGEAAGGRLDKALAQALPDLSRARLQALIENSCVSSNREPILQASRKVKAGEVYIVSVPPAVEALPRAQKINLDIVYEDKDLLVINKASDMVVHPGAGNHDGTLVNALLAHCGDQLSGIGGVKRPGIVHRLDKETSGLMIVAKNDISHQHLSKQLSSRTLKRTYQAIVWGLVSPTKGRIETLIGRSKTNRQKMAVLPSGGKEAVTDYARLEAFGHIASLVECRLQTGRTHQIRVHMAHIGHHLVGDPVYGRPALQKFLKLNKIEGAFAESLAHFPRQALHAVSLEFIHPISENKMGFSCDLPEDMSRLLKQLKKYHRG